MRLDVWGCGWLVGGSTAATAIDGTMGRDTGFVLGVGFDDGYYFS